MGIPSADVADLKRDYERCAAELQQKQKVLGDVSIGLDAFRMHRADASSLAGIEKWVARQKRAVDKLSRRLEALEAARVAHAQRLLETIRDAHDSYRRLDCLKRGGPSSSEGVGSPAAPLDATSSMPFSSFDPVPAPAAPVPAPPSPPPALPPIEKSTKTTIARRSTIRDIVYDIVLYTMLSVIVWVGVHFVMR